MPERQMCHDCPFRLSSKSSKFLLGWLDELAKYPSDLPQGCHTLPDGQTKETVYQADPELQCVGHRQHLEQLARK